MRAQGLVVHREDSPKIILTILNYAIFYLAGGDAYLMTWNFM